MARHSAQKVAARILAVHYFRCVEQNTDPDITNMKLQKLLYCAQGGNLAVAGDPLFEDPIVARRYGPVVESVYQDYEVWAGNPIGRISSEHDVNDFDPLEMDLTNQIMNIFGDCSSAELRDMNCNEPPWQEAFSHGSGTPLDLNLVKKLFETEYLHEENDETEIQEEKSCACRP